jgi:hypothetical protein
MTTRLLIAFGLSPVGAGRHPPQAVTATPGTTQGMIGGMINILGRSPHPPSSPDHPRSSPSTRASNDLGEPVKLNCRIFVGKNGDPPMVSPESDRVWWDEFPLGRFTCTLTISARGRMCVEWGPGVPKRGEITEGELQEYRQRRNILYRAVATATGQNLMVVD